MSGPLRSLDPIGYGPYRLLLDLIYNAGAMGTNHCKLKDQVDKYIINMIQPIPIADEELREEIIKAYGRLGGREIDHKTAAEQNGWGQEELQDALIKDLEMFYNELWQLLTSQIRSAVYEARLRTMQDLCDQWSVWLDDYPNDKQTTQDIVDWLNREIEWARHKHGLLDPEESLNALLKARKQLKGKIHNGDE